MPSGTSTPGTITPSKTVHINSCGIPTPLSRISRIMPPSSPDITITSILPPRSVLRSPVYLNAFPKRFSKMLFARIGIAMTSVGAHFCVNVSVLFLCSNIGLFASTKSRTKETISIFLCFNPVPCFKLIVFVMNSRKKLNVPYQSFIPGWTTPSNHCLFSSARVFRSIVAIHDDVSRAIAI